MVRLRALIVATALAVAFVIAPASPAVRAGGGFGELQADATFGVEMTFSATWSGSEPDLVELLLGFGSDDRLVVPVELNGDQLAYERDLTSDYVPPNTTVAYQWRAVTGAEVSLSAERTLVYDDDRPQFDWEQDQVGSATVHWYGPNEAVAREFGDLAGDAADAAGDLLGRPLADPIDIFVYDEREDFLGAVGPATREWVGAATYPDIRTVFMWLGAGSDVALPPQPDGRVVSPSAAPEPSPDGTSQDVAWWLIIGLVIVGVVFVAVVVWRGRRSNPPAGGPPS